MTDMENIIKKRNSVYIFAIVQCCRIPGERIEEISGGAETGNILQRELEIGNPTEKENVAD